MLQAPENQPLLPIRAIAGLLIAASLTFGLFLLWEPFFLSLTVGGVVALLSRPLYDRCLKWVRSSQVAAGLSLLIVLVIIILPLGALLSVLIREVTSINATVHTSTYSTDHVNSFISSFATRLGLNNFHVDIKSYALQIIQFIGSRSISILGGVFGTLGSLFLALIAAFYILQNHESIRAHLIAFSPLRRADTQLIIQRTREVIQATVSGNLLIVTLQSLTSMIGMLIFHVGSPVLFGILYGLASMIPIVGTALIYLPIALFEIAQGNINTAVGIIIWSIVQGALFDNVIGPQLIEKRAHLHPFFILLGVLGGVARFGILGIVLGPTIVALGMIGLEILRHSWQSDR